MLVLIENSNRGLSVAEGLWGAFNSCLYIQEDFVESLSMRYVIAQSAKSEVVLIIVTNDVKRLKNKYKHAICIYCDGSNSKADENDIVYYEMMSRDAIVGSLITHLKRKKLL